ncbi:hypothetical protein GCM10010399_62220 [Dactylosporangium fulvum]
MSTAREKTPLVEPACIGRRADSPRTVPATSAERTPTAHTMLNVTLPPGWTVSGLTEPTGLAGEIVSVVPGETLADALGEALAEPDGSAAATPGSTRSAVTPPSATPLRIRRMGPFAGNPG